jgi:hypothetical protein
VIPFHDGTRTKAEGPFGTLITQSILLPPSPQTFIRGLRGVSERYLSATGTQRTSEDSQTAFDQFTTWLSLKESGNRTGTFQTDKRGYGQFKV